MQLDDGSQRLGSAAVGRQGPVSSGSALRERERPGIEVLSDVAGIGAPIRKRRTYLVRLRMWLHRGEPVRWRAPWGLVDRARLEDDGESLVADLRIDRSSLIAGLFYGVQGMRIGGIRRLRIASHLAYGERGVPETIPANALLTVELQVLEERVEA